MISFRLSLCSLLLAFVLVGAAVAEHDPSGDKFLGASDRAAAGSVLPVDTVHDITFGTLAEVRERLERNTGDEVEYSLVWICVGDDCMAVDPFRFNR